jgi:hypothetical protein
LVPLNRMRKSVQRTLKNLLVASVNASNPPYRRLSCSRPASSADARGRSDYRLGRVRQRRHSDTRLHHRLLLPRAYLDDPRTPHSAPPHTAHSDCSFISAHPSPLCRSVQRTESQLRRTSARVAAAVTFRTSLRVGPCVACRPWVGLARRRGQLASCLAVAIRAPDAVDELP